MTTQRQGNRRILHIVAQQGDGAALARAGALASGLGTGCEHDLAIPGARAPDVAGSQLRPLAAFPELGRIAMLGKLQRLAKAMVKYDLIFTYDYATINAVMARTAFSRAFALPALIHHEFEPHGQSSRSIWYRRIALDRAALLIVASEQHRQLAITRWRQSPGLVRAVPMGIDPEPWRTPPKPDILPSLLKRPGEYWVGASLDGAPMRLAEGLIDAAAPLSDNWQLVLFGECEDPSRLSAYARKLDIAHRVHFPGGLTPAGREAGLLDIGVSLTGTAGDEAFALKVMASSRPLVAPLGSHIARLLPKDSLEFAIALEQQGELALTLGTLAADAGLKASAGQANRKQIEERHALRDMIGVYQSIIGQTAGVRQPG